MELEHKVYDQRRPKPKPERPEQGEIEFSEVCQMLGLSKEECGKLSFFKTLQPRVINGGCYFKLMSIFLCLRDAGEWTDYMLNNASVFLGISRAEFPQNWVSVPADLERSEARGQFSGISDQGIESDPNQGGAVRYE